MLLPFRFPDLNLPLKYALSNNRTRVEKFGKLKTRMNFSNVFCWFSYEKKYFNTKNAKNPRGNHSYSIFQNIFGLKWYFWRFLANKRERRKNTDTIYTT